MKCCFLFVFFLLFSACSSGTFYALPALPFSITVPSNYDYLDSSSTVIFTPDQGSATLVFEKEATDLPFEDLFEAGYEELTPKSSGIWVICEEEKWDNCYVQNMDFLELYPLHIRSDGALNEDEKAEVIRVLNMLRKD